MEKSFCDKCGRESSEVSNTLSKSHWCGNFVIDGIRAEVELKFDRDKSLELCFDCRMKFDKKLNELNKLDHYLENNYV
jgi:hypothetical protein